MIKNYTHVCSYIFVLCCLLASSIGNAQNISGIVNTYAKVNSISGSTFTVGTPAGKTGARIQDFNAGRKVLVYQAKGASIDESSGSSFGQVTSLGNAGKYEIATVVSRSGSDVILSTLVNTYDVAGLVQLINFIPYGNRSVTGTLSAMPWDKNNGYGGIVIVEAKRLTLEGNINVDGQGFTGGSRSANNGNGCVTVYRETNTIYGEKGEGISTYSTYTRGQGPLANGGGGASTHNGGGGGGSNHGKGSQGGIGWNCSVSTNGGGFGGETMSYTSSSQRLFFGGGGGGGQQNNSLGTNGGNGGGIVILLIEELTTDCVGTRAISARGQSSGSAGNDGAGGAGAGGVIYIHTQAYNPNGCNINLNVDGGNGGDVGSGAAHGGGGGGGSGLVYSSIAFPTGISLSGNNGTDGDDDTGGSQSGTDGVDEPIDIVVEPEAPIGSDPINGPGGYTDGLKMWLRADETTVFSNTDLNTPINNGQELKSWENEAASSNYINLLGGSSNAIFLNSNTDLLNFNPIVRLNATDRNLQSELDVEAQTFVVVAKSLSTNEFDGLVGIEGDRGVRLSSNANVWRSSGSNDWASGGGDGSVNGASGYTHNQEWHIVYQEKQTAFTDNLFVGGYYSGRSFTGDIAEVVAYDNRLGNLEQQEVESYLALKYGITLQGKDYRLVNQNVWRPGSNTGYNNDIAGIGRDDLSKLNQSKSKSINTDAVLTIEAESAINNADFFMWGNNDQSLSGRNSTDIPSAWGERITRVWRTRLVGSPGNITVTFDLSALGITNPKLEDFALLIDNNTTFIDATEHTTGRSLNVSENTISFTGVNIPTNRYFTLVTKKKPAPGGVDANLEFWLKANAGTGSANDGDNLDPWEDQLDVNDAIQSGSINLPTYKTDRLNFNPVMDYSSAANQAYSIANSGDINQLNNTLEKSFTIVFTTGFDIANRQVLYEEGGATRGINAYIFNDSLYLGAWNKANDGAGSNWDYLYDKITIALNTSYILTFNMKGNDSKTGVIELVSEGKIEKTIGGVGRLYAHGAGIGLGAMINASYFEPTINSESGDNYYFKGDLAEITYAKEYLDAAKRNRLESYLAIKYGITLDQSAAQNYTASNGIVVWSGSSNTSYNTDIAGIAKDDDSELEQLKSKSVNASSILTIANGTDVNSPTSFSLDNSFLIWGHNDGSNTALTGDYLGKSNSGMARIWRVSEKGSAVGNVRLQVADTDMPTALTHLLISPDPTFPNTIATRKIVLSTGTMREVTANFADGEYFTFSKTNTAPQLANMESSVINYCKDDVFISETITVADDDDGDDLTAIITFESGYQAAEDALDYIAGSGVTIVSQTGSRIEIQANAVDMQAALRAITYSNSKTDGSRTTGNRVVSFILNDGVEDSLKRTRTISPSVIPQPVGIFFGL